MQRSGMLATGIALVVIGIIGLSIVAAASESIPSAAGERAERFVTGAPVPGGFGPGRMMGRFGRGSSPSSFTSNGEEIYFTGVDDSGVGVVPSSLPMGSMMRLACVDCHGPDRTGGLLMPDGRTRSADISSAGLRAFDATTVAREITRAVDEKGAPLASWMPSWSMSPLDLGDLVDYLRSTP
jgi:cytochrome c oxidase subunit II